MVNVFFGVEGPWTYANCTVWKRAQRTMDVRRAVQARPYGNVERLVEDTAYFRGRESVTTEAESGDVLRHIPMAEDPAARNFVQPMRQAFDQCNFVPPYCFQAFLLHIFDTRAEPGNAQNIRGAAFQEVGELAWLRLAG